MPAPPAVASRLDTRYAAETPEGISLWLRPAGVVPRFYAYLLDALIRFVFFSACFVFLTFLGGLGLGLGLLLFFLLEWFYPVAFELSAGARRRASAIVGLKVVMDNGLPITPAASLTRNLLRAADFLPFAVRLRPCSRCCCGRTASASATSPPATLVVQQPQRRSGARHAAAGAGASAGGAARAARQAAIVAWAGARAALTDARARRARRARRAGRSCRAPMARRPTSRARARRRALGARPRDDAAAVRGAVQRRVAGARSAARSPRRGEAPSARRRAARRAHRALYRARLRAPRARRSRSYPVC